jgi:hypothetical protein
MSDRQIEELARGTQDLGRPFPWVLRKDNRTTTTGFFVTHCGWKRNSTLESVACRSEGTNAVDRLV